MKPFILIICLNILTVAAFAQKQKVRPFNTRGKDTVTLANGLKYIICQKGTGKQAVKGDKVKVHYTGYLLDGSIFDSSVQNNSPFKFILGAGKVIRGWDEGIALMSEGDKFRFIIPPVLGYGTRGAKDSDGNYVISPNSTLIFDVELIQVK